MHVSQILETCWLLIIRSFTVCWLFVPAVMKFWYIREIGNCLWIWGIIESFCLFGLAGRVIYYIIKDNCTCKLKRETTLQHLLLFRVMFNSFLTQRWTSLLSVYFVPEINERCISMPLKRKILSNLKLQSSTWLSFYWLIKYIHTYVELFCLSTVFSPQWTNSDLFIEANYEPVNQDSISTCHKCMTIHAF